MEFSVPMALFDFVPVILFTVSAVIFQRDFYSRMNKGCFAVYCAGTIMVTAGGLFKATYKLLYAAGVCDFPALSECFMPFQATGFTLAAIAVLAYVFGKGSEKRASSLAVVPPLVESKFLFVIFMVLGVVLAHIGYAVIAFRKKRAGAGALFLVSMLLELGMGYLSTRDFSKASMNWIGEVTNFAGMLTLLLATNDIHKNVFNKEEN